MAEVKVTIGGRDFEVACRDGEEHFLQSAAALLDNEAGALNQALGRMPETRMLLMAGLMLADKTASLEDQLKQTPVVQTTAKDTTATDASATDASAAAAASADESGARKRARKAEMQLSAIQTEMAELKAELAELQSKGDSKSAEMNAEMAAKLESAKSARDAALEAMTNMVAQVETSATAFKKVG
jgi:cell division protein ZapA